MSPVFFISGSPVAYFMSKRGTIKRRDSNSCDLYDWSVCFLDYSYFQSSLREQSFIMPSSKARAISRRKSKKRKGFKGTQYQQLMLDAAASSGGLPRPDVPEPLSTSTPSKSQQAKASNISKEKLQNSSLNELDITELVRINESFSLVQIQCFVEALEKSVICKECQSAKSIMKLEIDERKRQGLAEQFTIKCSECNAKTSFFSSRKISNGIFEVIERSVIASNSLAGGRQALADFCATMNLPRPLALSSFSRHSKQLSNVTLQLAERKMKEAADRVRKTVIQKNPNIEKEDKEGAVPVAVSVDGTWHKRGFSSKYGVVVAILVDTGEVIDFDVLSKHCYQCKKHERDDKSSIKYKKWMETHKASCQINHQGSSGEMEGVGALRIFCRSIEKYKLKYTTFVGDGDSDTFKVVKEGVEKKYGPRYHVTKEECIGHVQKRMGNALRRFVKGMTGKRMSDNRTVGGKGRLTKIKIDQIQKYYGQAIRQNVGDLSGMQNVVWAIFQHTVKPATSVSLESQHSLCPKGSGSWCKFNSDLVTKGKTYHQNGRLPSVFFEPLKPIFERLASRELLQKCQRGLTQNQNESFNNLIWKRCPKVMFFGKERIVFAVSEAVCTFNTRAGAKAVIMKAAGINNVGINLLLALRRKDNARLASAAQKVANKYKYWRFNRKKDLNVEAKKVTKHYEAGGFDCTGEKSQRGIKRRRSTVQHAKSKRLRIQATGNEERNFDIVEKKQEDIVEITRPVPVHIIVPFNPNE